MFKLHCSGNSLFNFEKHANLLARTIRSASLIGLLIILTACQTYRLDSKWPPQMPPRQVFIDDYLQKHGVSSAKDSDIAYHLSWVKRFYQGTTLYPVGWLSASERYLKSITSEQERQDVDRRLVKLGVKIVNEWAQGNKIRRINSSNIATWASAMRNAAETQQQLAFLGKVERDVSLLINKELLTTDIRYERYFEEESYDDF